MAWEYRMQATMQSQTAQGVYERTLALTGDEDKAGQARAEFVIQSELARLTNGKS